MDFDASLILMGLPIAFGLGWLASRFDMRQLRIENRQAPKAYQRFEFFTQRTARPSHRCIY